MDKLINTLNAVFDLTHLENYQWDIPNDCPISIPSEFKGNYDKNIYIKENFSNLIENDEALETHYWIIQKWGGIGSFKQSDRNDARIRKFLAELDKGKLTKDNFDVISSLSKVASFLDYENYVIYDSRVIYTLNWLIFKSSEEMRFFPQPVGRSTDLAKYDMQTIFRLSGRELDFYSHKDAYHIYCSLIKKLSSGLWGESTKPYMLEMYLFMIAPSWVVGDIEKSVHLTINDKL